MNPASGSPLPAPRFHVRVPASTSNLGAGFDCLGLALDLWLDARVVPGGGPPVYRAALAELAPESDIVTGLIRDHLPTDHHLELTSDIPVGRGLGSSAAAIVAGIALKHLLEGQHVDEDRLFEEANTLEGHPDNVGPAVYGGLVWYTNRPNPLTIHPSLAIALAIPRIAVDTKQARAMLPKAVSREIAVRQARGAGALVQGLVTADPALIAFGMQDQLAVPHRRKLIPGFDAAVAAGEGAGAHGVTISGAGSTAVAVCPNARARPVAAAMAAALTSAGNDARAHLPQVCPTGYEIATTR